MKHAKFIKINKINNMLKNFILIFPKKDVIVIWTGLYDRKEIFYNNE